MNVKTRLSALGVSIPEILMPNDGIDLAKYSVVACDQYTSNPAFWEKVEKNVGNSPSTLRMILPEVYLESNKEALTEAASRTMRDYLDRDIFKNIGECFVFVRRETSTGCRRGLVVAVDLERYDYSATSSSLIRATEGTIPDRLPPRVEIRQNAAIELPHIMVLIDDVDNILMGSLDEMWNDLPELYNFDLMEGAGHIEGRKVECFEAVADKLEKLYENSNGLLYAMGDGNHSLATAKLCWEYRKSVLSAEQKESDPARFALVELVNLHDNALAFEPIHRVLFNVKDGTFDVCDPDNPTPLQELQPALDRWLAANPDVTIDYIHGEDETRELGAKEGNIALIMPEFDKSSLFDIVRRDGALARKSFSMGEAPDKRHYLEAKRI